LPANPYGLRACRHACPHSITIIAGPRCGRAWTSGKSSSPTSFPRHLFTFLNLRRRDNTGESD
jgi:hypothetical protein